MSLSTSGADFTSALFLGPAPPQPGAPPVGGIHDRRAGRPRGNPRRPASSPPALAGRRQCRLGPGRPLGAARPDGPAGDPARGPGRPAPGRRGRLPAGPLGVLGRPRPSGVRVTAFPAPPPANRPADGPDLACPPTAGARAAGSPPRWPGCRPSSGAPGAGAIVDDSLAFGVLGRSEPAGASSGTAPGPVRWSGLDHDGFLWLASLAKAYGTPLTVITGDEPAIPRGGDAGAATACTAARPPRPTWAAGLDVHGRRRKDQRHARHGLCSAHPVVAPGLHRPGTCRRRDGPSPIVGTRIESLDLARHWQRGARRPRDRGDA